jgi:hypothetical protein
MCLSKSGLVVNLFEYICSKQLSSEKLFYFNQQIKSLTQKPMKTLFSYKTKIIFAAFFLSISFFLQIAQGGEFVIMNRTYTYPADGGAFDCHVKSYESMPSNWLYPDDYWNGHFYGYFELIDIPSNYTVGFQMGIYQYYKYNGKDYYETCSLVQAQLQGAGDATQVDYGSPADWWQHPNGGVDFTKVNEFEEVGLAIWSHMPGHEGIICPTSSGGDDIAYEVHDQFMPCTIRVIIVAVSSGSTFSGWDNYLGGGCTPVQQATPTYNVNFINETTNKIVPSNDEYSYYSDMSGSVGGTGQLLALTPGRDVYFRTKKANDCLLASNIQHLVVPEKPLLVYEGDATITVPLLTLTANLGADMTGFDLSFIDVSNGYPQNLRSANTFDVIPNDKGEVKVTIPANVFGGASFASNEVIVNYAPKADSLEKHPTPTYSIDFASELTDKPVPTVDEYSNNSNMSGAKMGTGEKVLLTPGQDIYFRTIAGGGMLASDIQHLVIPARPETPFFSIDYYYETTVQNANSDIEYSTSPSYTNPSYGTGNKIALIPGQDLYIWIKYTSNSFASMDYHLVVPPRPATPNYTIDYVNEKTDQNVSSDVEYSASETYTNVISGTGTQINLTPSQDLYFWKKVTSSSFYSEVFHLVVPQRNLLYYSGADTITNNIFTLQAVLADESSVINADNLLITNGTAINFQAGNIFDIYPESGGLVTVLIPANSVNDHSFVSNEVIVFYDKNVTQISQIDAGDFSIYPNPSNGLIYIYTRQIIPFEVVVLSGDGRIIRTLSLNSGENQQINLCDLQKGIYFLRIRTTQDAKVEKIVLE